MPGLSAARRPGLVTGMRLQRAEGRAEVAVSRREGAVRLDRLYQEGCGKAILPQAGAVPEVVFVNTSGGLTGGDRIAWGLDAGPGAALVATSQAAERVYRTAGGAAGGEARIATRVTAGAGARVDWLPQETILFDGGRLARSLEVDLAGDAALLAIESVVLGRVAMGESVATGLLSDQWRIRRDGRLVHAEALRLDAFGDGVAGLRGARAFATLAWVAPGAELLLDAARGMVGEAGAASAKPGVFLARWLSEDAQDLRAAVIRLLMWLRDAPLPRVWSL